MAWPQTYEAVEDWAPGLTPDADPIVVEADHINSLRRIVVGPLHVNVLAYATPADALVALPSGEAILHFPPGEHPAGNGLIVAHDNLTLKAEGRASLVHAASATANLLQFPSAGTPTNITIDGLTLDGRKADQTADRHGLVVVSGENITLRDVTVKDVGGVGIDFFVCRRLTLERVTVLNNGRSTSTNGTHAAVVLQGVQHADLSRVEVDGCTDMGIVCLFTASQQNKDITIHQSPIRNVHWIGIALGSGGQGFAVIGCVTSDITGNGIDTGSNDHVTVQGCVIHDCEAGIIPDGGSFHTYVGNTLRDIVGGVGAAYVSNGHGIGLNGGPGFVVAGNVLSGIAGHGIAAADVRDSVIDGNVIRNCGQAFAGRAGIVLFGVAGASCTNVRVANNRSFDDQGTKTQAYGLLLGNDATNCIDNSINDNDFRGNATASIQDNSGAVSNVLDNNRT